MADDKVTLYCKSDTCKSGGEFTITKEEQDYYEQRIGQLPRYCPTCSKERKKAA